MWRDKNGKIISVTKAIGKLWLDKISINDVVGSPLKDEDDKVISITKYIVELENIIKTQDKKIKELNSKIEHLESLQIKK